MCTCTSIRIYIPWRCAASPARGRQKRGWALRISEGSRRAGRNPPPASTYTKSNIHKYIHHTQTKCILVHPVGTYSKSRLTTESNGSRPPRKTPAHSCGRGHTVAVLTNWPRKSALLDTIRLLACFQGRNTPLCTPRSLSWLRWAASRARTEPVSNPATSRYCSAPTHTPQCARQGQNLAARHQSRRRPTNHWNPVNQCPACPRVLYSTLLRRQVHLWELDRNSQSQPPSRITIWNHHLMTFQNLIPLLRAIIVSRSWWRKLILDAKWVTIFVFLWKLGTRCKMNQSWECLYTRLQRESNTRKWPVQMNQSWECLYTKELTVPCPHLPNLKSQCTMA